MTDNWVQIADNRWRRVEVQTPTGRLTAEIISDATGHVYSVTLQGTTPTEGLTIPAIRSLAEAKQVGEILIAQFTNEPLPDIVIETKPLR